MALSKKPLKPQPVKKSKALTKAPKKKAPSEKEYFTLRNAAAHCGVSETTMKSYIAQHSDLPIHRKGNNNEGYQIDLVALDAWREKHNLLNWQRRQAANESGQTELPLALAHDKRKQKIEADLLQLKFDRETEKVVDKAEIVKMLSTRMAQFAKKLEALPTIIGRKLSLPPETIEAIRAALDDARYALVSDDEGYFSGQIGEENAESTKA